MFSLAVDRDVVDEVGRELEDFLALSRENPAVVDFLETPVVEPSAKVAALRKALEGRASTVLMDFLCLVVEKRRFAAFPRIVEAYRALADEQAGRVRAAVRTATPLTPAQRDEITAVLAGALKAEVELEAEVDPALLGGAVVTVDDRTYDGSLRSRLRRFRTQLIRSERP
jgi:F-type H+-transporting ATPase subunit delta